MDPSVRYLLNQDTDLRRIALQMRDIEHQAQAWRGSALPVETQARMHNLKSQYAHIMMTRYPQMLEKVATAKAKFQKAKENLVRRRKTEMLSLHPLAIQTRNDFDIATDLDLNDSAS